jgi:hypothetical protein
MGEHLFFQYSGSFGCHDAGVVLMHCSADIRWEELVQAVSYDRFGFAAEHTRGFSVDVCVTSLLVVDVNRIGSAFKNCSQDMLADAFGVDIANDLGIADVLAVIVKGHAQRSVDKYAAAVLSHVPPHIRGTAVRAGSRKLCFVEVLRPIFRREENARILPYEIDFRVS